MQKYTWVVLTILTAGFMAGVPGQAAEDLPNVVPAPRHMTWTTGDPAWLAWDKIGCFVANADGDISGGIDQVNARLSELGIDPLPVKDAGEGVVIRLSVKAQGDLDKPMDALPQPKAEGYRLAVGKDVVFVIGEDLPGLYYGLMTLRQLADKKGLPCVLISDWPDQRLRGTYIAGYTDWETRIPEFAALKLNLVLFEDGSLFELDTPEIQERWQKIFALCRKHFIEPVPELQSLGWGQHILKFEPRAVEGTTINKRSFEVTDDKVQSPDIPGLPPLKTVNGGFEEGEGNQITGWFQDPPGTGAVIEREGAYTGERCCRITQTEKGTMRVWQDIACPVFRPFEASCYLKTEDINGGYAYIEVYGICGDGDLGELIGKDAAKIGGTQDWQHTVTRFATDKYSNVRVYLRIQEAKGTAWFDDVLVTGYQAPNPLSNVIVTEASPVRVQSMTGVVTFKEGKDYQLTVPELKFPYGRGEPLGITLVPGSRIRNGFPVLVSYNYAPEGSITCCPSEPLYQEFMRKAIHNAVNYLKPKYLHIGHDEPRLMCKDTRCRNRKLTSAELFVDDIKKMREYALEADPAIRIMMWDDAVNPYQNAPMLKMETAAETIPKDVILCVWWYAESDVDRQIEQSTQYFLDLGFDITGSPWFNPKNAYQWAETLYRHGKDNPHALGNIYTSWAHDFEDPWGALQTTAEYTWTIDKPPFEPTGE